MFPVRALSPPKLRFKKHNMDVYESIFRSNFDTSIKPLNPPPFLLTKSKNLRNATVASLDPSPTQHTITPNPVTQVDDVKVANKEETLDAAVLLASMKNLTANELHLSTKPKASALPNIPDLERHFKRDVIVSTAGTAVGPETNSFVNIPNSLFLSEAPPKDYSRARTVSMDSHHPAASKKDVVEEDTENQIKLVHQASCISPTIEIVHTIPTEPNISAPKSPRGIDRRKRYLDDHTQDLSPSKEELTAAVDALKPKAKKAKISKASRPLPEPEGTKKSPDHTKAILRKKFSWKNYPELENFLIENREDYLSHSALNYTMQQKHYNNRLTERLIELAADCGYVFDEEAFTFVSIRDRIRCYFKSYVQSRKKRGVIIGYAARKAGLLSGKEVEKSAPAKWKHSSCSKRSRK